MNVLELTKEIDLPEVNLDHKYSVEESMFFKKVRSLYKRKGYNHPQCGEVLYFDVEGGHAYYMFLDEDPLTVLFLPIKHLNRFPGVGDLTIEDIKGLLLERRRKKGGRPRKKAEDSVIFKRILVSYSAKDYQLLKDKSSLYDKKLSTYIRESSLSDKGIQGKFVRKDYKELNANLNKVGNNLNQLVRAVNEGSFRFKDDGSKELFKEVVELFVEIKSKI